MFEGDQWGDERPCQCFSVAPDKINLCISVKRIPKSPDITRYLSKLLIIFHNMIFIGLGVQCAGQGTVVLSGVSTFLDIKHIYIVQWVGQDTLFLSGVGTFLDIKQ